MKFRFIRYGDPDYQKARMLRWEMLSKPLGLPPELMTPNEEQGIHLLAIEKNQVVGSVLFCPEGKHSGRLHGLAISDEYRGRRFGRKILACMEQTLRRHGYTEVILEVQEDDAIFYERLGFCPSGQINRWGYPHLAMRKALAS